MYLVTGGFIKVANFKGEGKLLFTDRSLFALKSNGGAMSFGGALGGLLGYLIVDFIDKQKAQKNPPAHLEDPEIAQLGDRVRRDLLTTTLLAKMPLDSTLSIKSTRLGFDFNAGPTVVSYGGWIHKKKIVKFLLGRGLHIDES